MQITLKQAQECIEHAIKAKLVPFLHGSPGSGKSDVVHTIADKYNLELIDLRLSQCDPTDLQGMPFIVENKTKYVPMDTFPLMGEELPKGKAGWLLFLDEANSATKAVQAASYKLVLDRTVGQHKLHDRVAIVCAGNLDTDNAIVEEMSTALQSRLVHLEVAVDSESWLEWAYEHGVNSMITSYIKFKPSSLYTFKPNSPDKTYACPRTWQFADKLFKVGDVPLPLLAGTLGEGVAREFTSYMKIYRNIPEISEIVRNPTGCKVSNEPSVLFAITGSIAENASEKTIEKLMEYIDRLPMEFRVLTYKEMIKRDKDKKLSKFINPWISKNVNEIV